MTNDKPEDHSSPEETTDFGSRPTIRIGKGAARRPSRLNPDSPGVSVRFEAPVMKMALTGDVVVNNLLPVKETFYRAIKDHRPGRIEVDLFGVPYMDSMALGMLLEFHRATKQMSAEFVINRPSEEVERIMKVMGLDQVFVIERRRSVG